MILRQSLTAATLVVSLLLAGCTEGPQGTATPTLSVGVTGDDATISDRLSAALAQGLSRPEARVALRNALRASPFTDHRVDLHAFLADRTGQTLIESAARESGINRETITRWIGELGSLDIYVPFREHRLRWRGGDDIRLAVVAAPDEGADAIVTFAPDGTRGTLTRDDGVPAYTLVVIAPSEYKLRRSRSQPDTPGSVIQDPSDGDGGGELVLLGPDGRTTWGPVAVSIDAVCPTSAGGEATIQECTIGGGGDGGLSPVPSADTTFLRSFEIHEGFEPFWDGSMELRMEFKHHYYQEPGATRQTLASAVVRFSGISANRLYMVEKPVLLSRLTENGREGISYWIDEEDAFFSDWVGWVECRQLDGCFANGVPLKVYWKNSDCTGHVTDYAAGCRYRHTATMTTRWTPKRW